jgi:hypothetical protein
MSARSPTWVTPQNVTKKPSSADSLLVRNDVSHLMPEHAGEFVVVLGEHNHFARDVDASSDQAESMGLMEFN